MSETQAIISTRREFPVPPQALEAEQSVLGCLLLDSRLWDDVVEVVLEEDFYTKAHREIFAAIKALHAADQPVDVVTTSEWLGNCGMLDKVGGLPYLGELAKNTPGTVNVIAYAAIVRERSVLRRLINVSTQISEKAYNPEGSNVEELLGYAEKLVFDIAEADKRQKGGFVPVQNLLTEALDRIEELYESGQSIQAYRRGSATWIT